MGRPKGYVMSFGVNDADYDVDTCPFYNRWRGMLARCYSKANQDCYNGCVVCIEWLTFSNFKAWMKKQDWVGNELDKDILFKGNKVYSPTTCCFVSNAVNSFVIDHAGRRGDMPLGVKLEKRTGKYTAQVRNPFTKKAQHLGTFDTSSKAEMAWKNKKHEFSCALADLQSNSKVSAALRVRYAD